MQEWHSNEEAASEMRKATNTTDDLHINKSWDGDNILAFGQCMIKKKKKNGSTSLHNADHKQALLLSYSE